MVKKIASVLFILCTLMFVSGCAKRVVMACSPIIPGVEKMIIQLVCPVYGASYETEVYKCPGDKHYRVDVICKLCGRRHHYVVNYWPHDYWPRDYYFFGGWFYRYDYWQRYGYGYPRYIGPPYIYPPERPARPIGPRPPTRPPREINQPRQIQPPTLIFRREPREEPRTYHPPAPPPQTAQPAPPRQAHQDIRNRGQQKQ